MSEFDVVAVGRAGLDLYAEQVGVPFEKIRSFAAYVGGTPANIVVGARRLGLRAALVTAVSIDPVGDFIVHFLKYAGVETRYISRKPDIKSGMVLLGINPPDEFPRVHYRDDCADHYLSIDDVKALPMDATRMLVVAGTSLTHSPAREATLFAAEQARDRGVGVLLDLDYRADLWPNPHAYATSLRGLLRASKIVIGTEEEITAASSDFKYDGTASRVKYDGTASRVRASVRTLFKLGPDVIIEKRGAGGARIYLPDGEEIDAAAFRSEVQNTLGAGDAFAAGFLYGYLRDWGLHRSARFGNACGAFVVGRHGCSASCPTLGEITMFMDEQGGL